MEVFPPEAVIFDLDGVLLDSFEVNRKYYSYIAAQMGLPKLSRQDQELVHRLTHQDALLHLAGPERLQEALQWGREEYARELQKNLRLFPLVRETLTYLQSKLPLAVGTNRNSSALELLRELKLMDFFVLALTVDTAPAPKPEKKFMEYLLLQIGWQPEQVVYVGDSLVDEQLCANAGVRLLAFKNPQLKAWRHADEFADIPGLLGLAATPVNIAVPIS